MTETDRKPVTGRVCALYRHPVKGMTPEALDRVALEPGAAVPGDRRFGLAFSGVSGTAARHEWLPCANFLRLAKHPRLATLEARFDDETEVLTIFRGGRQVTRGKATDAVGRAVLEDFFDAYMKDDLAGKRAKLIEAEAVQFSDDGENRVSLLNAASILDLERVTGRPVDARRFRANIVIEGAAPWAERTWIGSEISVGGARLAVEENIVRCAATTVNPDTAERDLNIPKDLQRGFRHVDMGVYCRVVTGGAVAVGDAVGD
jgi:uncharacterized protein YcbX